LLLTSLVFFDKEQERGKRNEGKKENKEGERKKTLQMNLKFKDRDKWQ
jgi:hypothetical protein